MKLKKSFNTKLVNLVKTGLTNSGQMFSTLPNTFEPIRKDLWSIEFPVTMNIPEALQVSAARPKVTNANKEIMFKNLSTFYKGKTKVEPITIVFRDAIGTSIYQKLMQWQREHTDFATGKGGYASTYKKTLTLNMEDPTGAVIQKFVLYGCFIVDLDGGEINQESDDIAQVSMQIQYDSYDIVFA
jgi:hypothetical protein